MQRDCYTMAWFGWFRCYFSEADLRSHRALITIATPFHPRNPRQGGCGGDAGEERPDEE